MTVYSDCSLLVVRKNVLMIFMSDLSCSTRAVINYQLYYFAIINSCLMKTFFYQTHFWLAFQVIKLLHRSHCRLEKIFALCGDWMSTVGGYVTWNSAVGVRVTRSWKSMKVERNKQTFYRGCKVKGRGSVRSSLPCKFSTPLLTRRQSVKAVTSIQTRPQNFINLKLLGQPKL